MTAAIYYHPEAYTTAGPKLMGRNAAGESFMRGFLQHVQADTLWVQVENEAHAQHFAEDFEVSHATYSTGGSWSMTEETGLHQEQAWQKFTSLSSRSDTETFGKATLALVRPRHPPGLAPHATERKTHVKDPNPPAVWRIAQLASWHLQHKGQHRRRVTGVGCRR
jgi:hypothetical protein